MRKTNGCEFNSSKKRGNVVGVIKMCDLAPAKRHVV